MTNSKKYSPAVATLFPETSGWVDANKKISPADAAKKLLDGLSELVGSETAARKILASNPSVAALLPKRKRGRPARAMTKLQTEDAWLIVHESRVEIGVKHHYVRDTASYIAKLSCGRWAPSYIERGIHSAKMRAARKAG